MRIGLSCAVGPRTISKLACGCIGRPARVVMRRAKRAEAQSAPAATVSAEAQSAHCFFRLRTSHIKHVDVVAVSPFLRYQSSYGVRTGRMCPAERLGWGVGQHGCRSARCRGSSGCGPCHRPFWRRWRGGIAGRRGGVLGSGRPPAATARPGREGVSGSILVSSSVWEI